MTRLATTGFELREKTLEGGASPVATGTVTLETGIVHTILSKGGSASMKMKGAAASYLHYPGFFLTGAKERWTYYRHYVYVDKAPGGTREIIRYMGPESAPICSLKLTVGGNLLFFNALNVSTEPAGLKGVFGFGSWQLVELAVWTHATVAATCKVKVRVNGTIGYEPVAFTGATIVPEGTRFGWVDEAENTASIYFDDLAANDETGAVENSWCDEAVIAHALPVSDKARSAGMVAGAAPTTEKLWEGLDNAPPVGVAAGSSTHGSQIKDEANNATDTYEGNLATYEAIGLKATDVVKVVQGVYMGGNSTTTSRTLAGSMISNPEIAEATLASGTTAAAAHPTGWKLFRTAAALAPTLSLGTNPVIRVRKGTASTNVMMYEYAGALVEWKPVEAGGKALVQELADGVTVTDAVTKGVGKQLADGAKTSDGLTKASTKQLADFQAVTESIAKKVTKPVGDTTTATDGISMGVSKSLTDTVTVSDQLGTFLTIRRVLEDTIAVADSMVRNVGKQLADAVTTTDSIEKKTTKQLADSVTVTDSLSKRVVKVLNDAVHLSDKITLPAYIGTFIRYLGKWVKVK